MSGEILFCGDLHGEREHVLRVADERPDAAFVLLGDIEPPEPLEQWLAAVAGRVWFIHGNHDTDNPKSHDNLFASAWADRNLHGRVVNINGVRVAGLGGVFRERIWMPPAPRHWESAADYRARCGKGNLWRGKGESVAGMPLKHRSTIFPDTVDRLALRRADVLVCHEAPSCHCHGFEMIDLLAAAMGVKVVFHGHQHDRLDYSAWSKATGIRAHGVGLRGITDLDGNVVVPGDLDEQRMHRQRDGQ